MTAESRAIVRFSDLDDARAALAAMPPGRPFLLVSAPDAAGRLGARYLLEVARRVLAERFPDSSSRPQSRDLSTSVLGESPSRDPGSAAGMTIVDVAIDCGADVAAALDAIEADAPAILIAPHPALEGLARARGILALRWNPNGALDLMP